MSSNANAKIKENVEMDGWLIGDTRGVEWMVGGGGGAVLEIVVP